MLTIGIRTFVPAEHATAKATVLVAGPAAAAHTAGDLAALALILTVVLLVAAGETIGAIIAPFAKLVRWFLQLVLFWVLLLALTGLVLAALLLNGH